MPREIRKPVWMVYAAEVQTMMNALPFPHGKTKDPFRRHYEQSYKVACESKGYEGTLEEWRYLVDTVGRKLTGDEKHWRRLEEWDRRHGRR